MEPGMKVLYFGDRLVVVLNWHMLMLGINVDAFGGVSCHLGVLVVTWRVGRVGRRG